MSGRRAVITGLGVVSPLGLDLVSFWDALSRGRSGVRSLPFYVAAAAPVQFGGAVQEFEPKVYLDKKDRKRLSIMVRTIQFAVAASHLAINDAHLDKTQIDPTRFGVLFGSSTLPSELKDLGEAGRLSRRPDKLEIDLQRWGEVGLPCIPPMWMLSHIPNMSASHVSILHNAQGPNNTITQSELGATLAVGEAMRNIRLNRADLFLVGGGDTMLEPINFVRYTLAGYLSTRNEAPDKACRPFDRHRDGRVLGEGGGVMLVEELEHARRRGARIYAEIVGFAATVDPGRKGPGLVRALRLALSQAQIAASAIGHINANGLSTIEDDAWEARALAEVFGPKTPPVFAVKSYFGNLGAATSPVEMAASLLALENNVLPATLNYEQPDPACPIYVAREAGPLRSPYFVKIGCTEMGQTAVIVARKF